MILPLTLLVATALPQQQYTPIDKTDVDDVFAFEWDGVDIAGNPVQSELAEFVFRVHPVPDPAPAPIRLPTQVPPGVGTNEYLVRLVLRDIELGTYKVSVRVKATNGEYSDEGNNLFIEVTSKKPAALRNFRHVAKP